MGLKGKKGMGLGPPRLRSQGCLNRTHFTILLFSIMASAQVSLATPDYFLDVTRGFISADQPCVSHPHTNSRKHGTPIVDSNITFEARNTATNETAEILCPGAEYTLTVSFPSPRAALLNANPPLVTFSRPNTTANCPNQVIQSPRNVSTFVTRFHVNCSALGSNLVFKVTSAGRDDFGWKYASWSVAVAAGNPQSPAGGACAAAVEACRLAGDDASVPTASGDDDVDDESEEEDEEEEKAETLQSATKCTPSPLGYDCMATGGKVIVHWSINTKAAPSNPCTPSTKTVVSEADVAQYGTIHMAAESVTRGYVGLGFAENPDNMYRSDIQLGWVDGSGAASISTYYATGNGIDSGDAVLPTWAYDAGVVRNASTGVTTICFSRRLVDSRARAVPDLTLAIGGISSAQGARRSLSEASVIIPGKLGLIWAVSPSPRLVQHRDEDAGGFFLNLASGSASQSEDEGGKTKSCWVEVHGALMAVAWGLMLPLGTLLPAHRWLLGDVKLAGKHLWFWLHLLCQWTGMGLFIAGFVIAFVQFDFIGSPDPEVAEAHENIGIAVMAAAGAQVVLGFIRPAPDHSRRALWNLLHHNLGRLTILLAWANVYIGIYLAHTSWGASYVEWITPIAIVMGLLVLTDLVLRVLGRGKNEPDGAHINVYITTENGGDPETASRTKAVAA